MAANLDNKTPLGKLILKSLYLKGKNQKWLAGRIGVDASHISILCSRIQSPKVKTLEKLSIALDIELAELFKAVVETVETFKK